MKRLTRSVIETLLLISLLAGPVATHAAEPAASSATEVIDQANVDVRFRVKVMGMLNITGHFKRLFGTFVSNSQGSTTGVRMQIDASSVSTDEDWRDDLLRGPGFFAADRYPHITFSGACLGRGENGAMRLAGNLNMRGSSQPVVFEFEPGDVKPYKGADVYQARTVIRRSAFGLSAMERLVSDKVEIIVAMKFGSGE